MQAVCVITVWPHWYPMFTIWAWLKLFRYRKKSALLAHWTLRAWKASYDKYLNGEMVDADLSDDVIAQAMKSVPVINA